MESAIYKFCNQCGSRNRYTDGSVTIAIIMAVCVMIGIGMLGYIEEMNMKKCNRRFDEMNMSNPCSVMEYLQSIASKPIWRVGLMSSALLAGGLTLLYVLTDQMNPVVYFFMVMAIAYIFCVCLMSYTSWHIIVPDGGQRCSNKLAEELERMGRECGVSKEVPEVVVDTEE